MVGVSTNGKPLRDHDDPMNEPLPSLRDSMGIGLMLIPGLASGATACRPFGTRCGDGRTHSQTGVRGYHLPSLRDSCP